jgi:regulator of replication initiation timing
MKKRFLINVLIVGAACLVIFGILQKGQVEKMKEKNKNLLNEKQQLQFENQKLKESLENLSKTDSSQNSLN